MSTEWTLNAEVLLTWLTLIVAVVGAVVGVGRWTVRSLDRRIEVMTRPIQPEANGSLSLPDVARSIQRLADSNDQAHKRLHERIDSLGTDVRTLELWAGERPCLLERDDRLARVKERLQRATDLESAERRYDAERDRAGDHPHGHD